MTPPFELVPLAAVRVTRGDVLSPGRDCLPPTRDRGHRPRALGGGALQRRHHRARWRLGHPLAGRRDHAARRAPARADRRRRPGVRHVPGPMRPWSGHLHRRADVRDRRRALRLAQRGPGGRPGPRQRATTSCTRCSRCAESGAGADRAQPASCRRAGAALCFVSPPDTPSLPSCRGPSAGSAVVRGTAGRRRLARSTSSHARTGEPCGEDDPLRVVAEAGRLVSPVGGRHRRASRVACTPSGRYGPPRIAVGWPEFPRRWRGGRTLLYGLSSF